MSTSEDQEENMDMGHSMSERSSDVVFADRRGSDIVYTDIPPQIPPRSTSVIVSITGDRSNIEDSHHAIVSDAETISRSATVSPSFGHDNNTAVLNHRLMARHLQVRQTLSEPSKAKLNRTKQHRMSPIPKRHDSALSKTLSMGVLDGTNSGWNDPHSPTAMDSAHSSNDSLNTNSSEGGSKLSSQQDIPTPIAGLTISSKFPSLTGSPLQMSPAWILPTISTTANTSGGISGQTMTLPTQEQMEILQQKQMEMVSLIEQQKQLVASAGGKPELFQFPITLWPTAAALSGNNPSPSSSNTSTSSPTPSLSSIDSGFQSIPPPEGTTTSTTTTTIPQHRPLGGSQSAPHGLKEPMTNEQYETLLRQFQLQHQSLVIQQQQMYQHYLEQQQRVMQQAMLEKKRFEDQQRQLAGIHLEQQQQLQRQQQVLRQMQEQQLLQLQRQQQLLLLQTLGIQQQHQASLQQKPKPPVHRVVNKSESLSLPYTINTSSISSSGTNVDMDQSGPSQSNLSPSIVHRSLSANSSVDSVGSVNGRNSPIVLAAGTVQEGQIIIGGGGGTGLVYDTMMLKHNCCCGSSHPEHPGRLQSIWARLHETGVVQRATRLRARKASLPELQTLHSENHVRLYGRPNRLKASQDKKDMAGMRAFVQMSCGGAGVDTDTYWNDQHTSNAARMAVGSVIELADKIINGDISNGLALIRPPGHHALPNQAMAFCYFNNVALAAKSITAKNKKVAIVDWDIHHGNGTQQIFYDNPSVLYISIHRYDNGTFFPGTGRPEEIGSGGGIGYNVNIAFSGKPTFQGPTVSNFGDPEYLAAFRSVVVPIIRNHSPDIILVSAGFNATSGHPSTLGGYSVTPKCYAHLTRMLMNCSNGKVALALEGGYELMSLCESAENCMRALLSESVPVLDSASTSRPPQPGAVASIEKTINCQKAYWSNLHQSVHVINMSHSEAERCDETVAALASLSMSGNNR